MNKWKQIIIYGVILVLLIVALVLRPIIFKDTTGDINTPSPTPSVDPVVKIDKEDVKSITVTNAKGELIIESFMEEVPVISIDTSSGQTSSGGTQGLPNQGETKYEEVQSWKLKSPADIPVLKSTITGKLSSFLDIGASTLVGESPESLSDYGLDQPSAKIRILLQSGEEIVVLYGNIVVGGGEYYCMVEGTNRVVTVTAYKAEGAMISYLDLVDKNLYGSINTETVRDFTFIRSKDSLEYRAIGKVIEENDDPGQGMLSWEVVSPIKAEAGYEGFQYFLEEICSISADEILALDPDNLGYYGLDKPRYKLSLSNDEDSVEIILGGDAGDGKIYGFTNFSNKIFTVYTNSFSYIDKPVKELVNSFAYMVSIWEVSNIEIKMPEQTIDCQIDDEQGSEVPANFVVNGRDANVMDSSDSSHFRKFYQSVISIFLEGIDIEAEPEDREDISIVYTQKSDGSKYKLSFSEKDENSYYCFINGEYAGFYVKKDDFYSTATGREGILPSFNMLMEAIDKQVDGIYN